MSRIAKALVIFYTAQALLGLGFGFYVGVFHGDEADAYIRGLLESINVAR